MVHSGDVQVFIQHHQVGALARSNAADFPIQANGPGGKQRGCLDGLLKGHAEGKPGF